MNGSAHLLGDTDTDSINTSVLGDDTFRYCLVDFSP